MSGFELAGRERRVFVYVMDMGDGVYGLFFLVVTMTASLWDGTYDTCMKINEIDTLSFLSLSY